MEKSVFQILGVIATIFGFIVTTLGAINQKNPIMKRIMFIILLIIFILIAVLLLFFNKWNLNTESTQNPSIITTLQTDHWTCEGEIISDTETSITIKNNGKCHISLSENEIIFGTADKFQEYVKEGDFSKIPCTAFSILGPIEYDIVFYWGGWDYYPNQTDISIDEKLSEKESECKQQHSDRDVQVVSIP